MDQKSLEKLFLVYLNGSAFSDCSIQVEDNKNRPLGLSKG